MDTQNTPTPTDIGSLFKKKAALTTWLPFKGGVVEFELKYISKAQFKSLYDSCTEYVYVPEQKARIPQLNGARFSKAFVSAAVCNWRKVTPANLAKLCEIDVSEIPADRLNEEIPFSVDGLAKLFEEVYELETTLHSAAVEIRTFRASIGDEEKNSEQSSSGS